MENPKKDLSRTDTSDGSRPRDPEPSDDQLEAWIFDSLAEATDGCIVEPDGKCEHGCLS